LKSNAGKQRRKDPLWARLLVMTGAFLMVTSGGGIVANRVLFAAATHSVNQQNLLGDAGNQAAQKGHLSITGAKNILMIGIDARPDQNPNDLVRSDSIIVLHIPASHDAAYLLSIPRDTWVEIPKYNNGKMNVGGTRDRINAAYAFGGQGLTGKEARKQAVSLLAQTIHNAYGLRFDAAAIVDFVGFKDVVKVLDGVDMYVDQETTSVHIGFNNKGQQRTPFRQYTKADGSVGLDPIAGVRPMVYHIGYQHLEDWQALDYVRQRETLEHSDYDRERHQQQFIKAIVKKIMSKGVLSNPVQLAKVLDVVGKAMTIDSGGIDLEDWVYAMRAISGDDVITLKTNNGTFNTASNGAEQLDETTIQLINAFRSDTVQSFLLNHADLIMPS
jgi:polyisoprenyl-teichoic acid--peptidoglycan teichoic acid transferase